MSAVPKPYITPEQYLELEVQAEGKSEYHDGEIFAMSGASPNHSLIVVNLYRILGNQLYDRPCTLYSNDTRVWIGQAGLYTYPDASIVCGEAQFDGYHTLLNPKVVIEVLSPSTEAYDRGRKFDMYQSLPSLQQYVLIAQDEPKVYVFTRQPGDACLLTSAAGPEGRIALNAIDGELSLRELYHKVPLKPPQAQPQS